MVACSPVASAIDDGGIRELPEAGTDGTVLFIREHRFVKNHCHVQSIALPDQAAPA